MASGCPVINTAIPHSGVPWVSPDGESGLTIPVGDSRALAAASRRLLDEPGLRDRMSRQAIERAHVEFDDGVMARRCLSFYGSALAASVAPSTQPKSRFEVPMAATVSIRDDVQAP